MAVRRERVRRTGFATGVADEDDEDTVGDFAVNLELQSLDAMVAQPLMSVRR
jgi:hypothetical protein